jgi:uncharacterized protein (TIGR02996 family)
VDVLEQELLAAIEREPEDPQPYLVYADYLQSRGSVRGELMALQAATEDRPGDHRISDAALDHVRANARYYLGDLAHFLDHPFLVLGWRCGFIGSAELTWTRRWLHLTASEIPAEHVVATLLELDAARFLTRLVVEPTEDPDNTYLPRVLAEQLPPTLRQLHLGPRDDWSALRDCQLGDLGRIWRRVPSLRELAIYGRIGSFGAIVLPELRVARIQLEAGSVDTVELMRELAQAVWPRLERLHLWSVTRVGADIGVLRRTDLVVLGDLGFINCQFADAICKELLDAPPAAQLYRLSFAKGGLTDRGIEALLAAADRLPNLATIDVSETFVSADAARALSRLAPEVIARDLRTGTPGALIPPLDRGEIDDDDY